MTIEAFLEKAKAKHKMPSWADDVMLKLEGGDEDIGVCGCRRGHADHHEVLSARLAQQGKGVEEGGHPSRGAEALPHEEVSVVTSSRPRVAPFPVVRRLPLLRGSSLGAFQLDSPCFC